jgi:hypothetical protein
MLVATFGPSTGWQGREIIWDVDRFILVGHGAIPAAGVLDYDRLGQLVWAQPELRAWVAEVHRWETGGQPAAAGAAVPAGAAGAPGRRGLPVWAIVLIVVAVVFVLLSVVAAVVLPAFIVNTTETFTNDVMVRAGVQSIRVGVESYAVAHGGRYPPAGEVNAVSLGAFMTAWPVNPYTDLPMVDGGGAGNYRYDVSPDGGAYELVGFGRDGQIVIDLGGGSGQSV